MRARTLIPRSQCPIEGHKELKGNDILFIKDVIYRVINGRLEFNDYVYGWAGSSVWTILSRYGDDMRFFRKIV